MSKRMEVIGMAVEKYIGENVTGFNCDFHYFKEEMERYHIYLKDDSNTRYKVSLENEYGECGSGWCTASYGKMVVEEFEGREPFTHRPKKTPLYVECELGYSRNGDLTLKGGKDTDEGECFTSNVFNFWEYGDDIYYPSGGINVNMDLFVPLKRAIDKRPVYIFKGKSGLCKSSLAATSSLSVYETDSSVTLPDEISADIVVVGNRTKFSMDEIVSKLIGNPKVIFVTFSE